MNSIATLPTLKGKRVLIRVDYNVPLKGNTILDSRRIESSYKTIETVLKKGGQPILLAHLGDGTQTLKPVARFLSKKFKTLFIGGDISDDGMRALIEHAQRGTVILLENIRRYPGEEKNNVKFSKLLASYGDVYVNDAFSVSHRAHASVVGVPLWLPSYAGFQLEREIISLGAVLSNKTHPFLFILGGAKFATKIPLLERFGILADKVIVGGAIVNNFYKTAGFEVGVSVVEAGYDVSVKKLLKNPKLLLPTDVVIERMGMSKTVGINEVGKKDRIVDIGSHSIRQIAEKIQKAKLIVWNGPTGWYEKGFTKGTLALARALLTSNAKAVIGGGDTAAVLEKLMKKTPLPKRIFISTGGGAALDFLAKGTLPGIEVLNRKQK